MQGGAPLIRIPTYYVSIPGADDHDLHVFLARRLTFNASLSVDGLVESFLHEYYSFFPSSSFWICAPGVPGYSNTNVVQYGIRVHV